MSLMIRRWIETNRAILVNTSSLVGTAAVTSILGFAFWLVAARIFSPAAVGLASAAISAMTLLGQFGVMGLSMLLIGELPKRTSERSSLTMTALIAAGTISLALGVIFALLAPAVISNLRALSGSPEVIALFAVGVSLTALGGVADGAVMGLLRGHLQFWRNTIFAVAKLLAMVAAGTFMVSRAGLTIYAAWAVGNVLSLVGLGLLVRAWRIRPTSLRPQWNLLGGLTRTALAHHALNQSLSITTLALPLIVTGMLSTTTNAYFYTAWMISGFAFMSFSAITIVLYAVGASDPAGLATKLRTTLSLSLSIGVSSILVLVVGASLILSILGQSYAEHGAATLRILSLAAFPLIIRTHYVTVSRLHNHATRTAVLMVIASGFEVAMAAFGARLGGLNGLSLAWVLALYIESAPMIPPVYRATFPREPGRIADEPTYRVSAG